MLGILKQLTEALSAGLKYLKREWISLTKYFLGMALLSYAIDLEIDASVGISALDMIQANIARLLGVSLGIGILMISGSLMLISMVIRRSLLPLGSVIPLIVTSILADAFAPVVDFLFTGPLALHIIEYILSIVIISFGAALMIVSKYPPTPYDNLVITLVDVTHKPIAKVRNPIELSFLAVGIFLAYKSGNLFESLNVGTLFFGITTSFVLQYCVQFLQKFERS